MTTLTQQQLDQMKQVGAQGGFVPTHGMSHQDKAAADAAVRSGQQGKK
ncbi:MAG: hypothetical protein ABJO57_10125 [Lentilitoribacter sp.]